MDKQVSVGIYYIFCCRISKATFEAFKGSSIIDGNLNHLIGKDFLAGTTFASNTLSPRISCLALPLRTRLRRERYSNRRTTLPNSGPNMDIEKNGTGGGGGNANGNNQASNVYRLENVVTQFNSLLSDPGDRPF
jgi:hypothetical protein